MVSECVRGVGVGCVCVCACVRMCALEVDHTHPIR